VLVGWYAWRIAPRRWRLLGPVHAGLTLLIVVMTGNHWWFDGAAAVAILVTCAWAVYGVRTAWRLTVRRRVPTILERPAEPVPA